MNPSLRFSIRAFLLVSVVAGIAIILLEPTLGKEVYVSGVWAALLAAVLGVLGYRSLRKGVLATDQTEMAKHVLVGMFLRLAILVVAHLVFFKIAGSERGQQALFATVLMYCIVLGLEVFTLSGELKSGVLRAPQSVAPEKPEQTEA